MGLKLLPTPSSTTISPRLQSQVEPSSSSMKSVEDSMARSYCGSVRETLRKLQRHSFVITDPYLPGHPIVYASEEFLHMTGYLAQEVIGRSPRFLQGPGTDRESILRIRDAVREEKPCHVILLNYTKQGWPYRVLLHMAPVFSQKNGQLLHFVGAHKPLSDCFSMPSVVLGKKSQFASNRSCHLILDDCSYYHSSGQRKKKMKIASTILQLVVLELVTCNRRMSNKDLCCRCLSENAQTSLCSSLTLALNRIQQSIVISDPKLPGMPIAYASDMFLQLTGYQRHEVIGRSCKFLQGQDTEASAIEQIREAIREGTACTVRILNYRKDGSLFWNLLHVAPVRDHTAKVAYFVGVQSHLGFPLLEDSQASRNATPGMLQLGAVGAVRVAVRSLQNNGLRRSLS